MTQMAASNTGARGVRGSQPAGAKTFFAWVGLSLGFALGGFIAYAVAGPVDSVVPALIGGALTGAIIGLAQWLVLRRTLQIGPEWIVATAVALAVGLALGAAAVGYETSASKLAIMGAISGAALGITQGLLLRGRFASWHVWMVAMPILWALGWIVTEAAGIMVEEQWTVFGAAGAITFGILSGLLLVAGLRRQTPAST
jgi:hypothetical protein